MPKVRAISAFVLPCSSKSTIACNLSGSRQFLGTAFGRLTTLLLAVPNQWRVAARSFAAIAHIFSIIVIFYPVQLRNVGLQHRVQSLHIFAQRVSVTVRRHSVTYPTRFVIFAFSGLVSLAAARFVNGDRVSLRMVLAVFIGQRFATATDWASVRHISPQSPRMRTSQQRLQ